RFEEIAGVVPVTVRWEDGGSRYCELTAPQSLELGPEITQEADLADLAWSLCLEDTDLVTAVHHPRVASVGLPFLCVEVGNRAALARAWLRKERWDEISGRVGCGSVHVYTRDGGGPQYAARCRMFMGTGTVREDPATGSANCALAGLLATCEPQASGTFAYRITQGVEMNRPSELFASVDKLDGAVASVRIGGHCVNVAEGQILVD
ncbi:MAG TPA: PhzF family phenazine biosynthesis isomerase, partial [Burkholderiaceae bacterium]|nr:PhzF family phenazine biosynthesis isomerase [Burkholderiaceae bacterium]